MTCRNTSAAFATVLLLTAGAAATPPKKSFDVRGDAHPGKVLPAKWEYSTDGGKTWATEAAKIKGSHTVPGRTDSSSSASWATTVPATGASRSTVAAPASSSTTRSPASTRAPRRTSHSDTVTGPATPSSGTTTGTRRDPAPDPFVPSREAIVHFCSRSQASTTRPTFSNDSAEQLAAVSRVVCQWG